MAAVAVIAGLTLLAPQSRAWLIQGYHYNGPGDYYAFDAFYSCTIAISRAYAQSGTNAACQIAMRSYKNGPNSEVQATCETVFKPSGFIDTDLTVGCPDATGAANQFTLNEFIAPAQLTASAAGTCSFSGTVMTCSACSVCTFQPFMTVFVGASAGTDVWIISQASGTPGGAGDYNTNRSRTAGSASVNGLPPRAVVRIAYNQVSPDTACSGGSCDASAPSDAEDSPFLAPSQIGSGTPPAEPIAQISCGFSGLATGLPCLYMGPASGSSQAILNVPATFVAPDPLTSYAVGMAEGARIAFIKTQGNVVNSSTDNGIFRNTVSGEWRSGTGSGATDVSATENVWHAAVSVQETGVGTTFSVDGSETTNGSGFVDVADTDTRTMFGQNSQGPFQGRIAASGWGSVTASSATRCQLIRNAHVLFGTALGSC